MTIPTTGGAPAYIRLYSAIAPHGKACVHTTASGDHFLHKSVQIFGRELMRPRSKRSDFGRALGAIVDVPVHLRNRLDHLDITVGNDSRHDQRSIFVRIDNFGAHQRIDRVQTFADGAGGRHVADADASR